MNSAEVLIKFKGDTKDAEKSTNQITSSIGQLTKSFTLGNLAAKAITKTLSVMTENMDSAIRRVDIMNNFPKVMKLFGVSADEASESINRIDQSVRGLPTSLDQAVAGVQNIFMVTQDLQEAEKLFQSINDSAMVFANGSTEAVNNFIYGYKQALSAGKASAQDFNQMNQAIPGLMTKVAEVIGVSYADLKEGLSKGTISIDQFNSALKKLDTEGVGSMSSLQSAAKTSTGGIKTSITNMKTAFVRGVANMITKIDEALQPFGGLKGVIQEIGKVGEQAFKKIGDVLANQVIPFFIGTAEQIQKNRLWLEPLAVAILAAIGAFKTVSTVISIINAAKTAFALLNAVMAANPIGVVIGLIAALVAVFIYCWNHCEAFRNFWIGLWEFLKQVVSMWVDGFKIMINGIVSFFGGIINWFKGMFNNWINGWRLILNFIAGVPGAIINFFTSLPGKMLNVGLDIVKGIGKGITNGVSWLKNRIREFVGNVTSFIKKVFKIGSPSKLMAQQVGQWLPKGIGVGITANTDSVYDAMDEMQEGIMSTYGLSPQMTNSMGMHYSPNVNVYNNVDVSTDPLGQTVSQIKTFSGGAKNDYNYGMGA